MTKDLVLNCPDLQNELAHYNATDCLELQQLRNLSTSLKGILTHHLMLYVANSKLVFLR